MICGSEQVTGCICVKAFDAEQNGVQVSQTARHNDGAIEMSLFCHGREVPTCGRVISFRMRKASQQMNNVVSNRRRRSAAGGEQKT